MAVDTLAILDVLFVGGRTDFCDDLVEPVSPHAISVPGDLDCVSPQDVATGFAKDHVVRRHRGLAKHRDLGETDARAHRGKVLLDSERAEFAHDFATIEAERCRGPDLALVISISVSRS